MTFSNFKYFIFCRFCYCFVFNCIMCVCACARVRSYKCRVCASIFNSFWLRCLNDGSTAMNENITSPHPCHSWRRFIHIFAIFFAMHTLRYLTRNFNIWKFPAESYQWFVEGEKKKATETNHIIGGTAPCECEMPQCRFIYLTVDNYMHLSCKNRMRSEFYDTVLSKWIYTRIQLDHALHTIAFGKYERETVGRVHHTMSIR